MTMSKRPDEAVLPQPSRPQTDVSGQRSRPSHLSRFSRYHQGLQPTGFPLQSGPFTATFLQSEQPCSYRNAAFQALLNAPMFVNFLRMHYRKNLEKPCAVKRDCLACATYELAGHYWHHERQLSNIEYHLAKLWKMCWDVFWGKEKSDNTRIGPSYHEDEFFTDAFLTQFLAAMHRQLEVIPSDHQTFSAMFTIHMARRWKCKSSVCNWTGASHKWESSYYLPIYVQKPHQKKPQTSILEGLHAGLKMWEQKKLKSRRGSILSTGMCASCGGDVEPQIDLVNLPELLILVRNTELLDLERDQPDLPYSDWLDLKAFTSNRNKTGDQGLRSYQLVSGTMDVQSPRKHGHAAAFARGPRDTHLWFAINDTEVVPVESIEAIDVQQRPNASAPSPLLLPEVFIYRRADDHGWHVEYQADDAPALSAALADDYQRNRLAIARSVHTIFNQSIGQGLLKFKVDVYPGDPRPQEDVEFSISLGYQLNDNHWAGKLSGVLQPLTQLSGNEEKSQPTPFGERAAHRAQLRRQGVILSVAEAEEDRRRFQEQYRLAELEGQNNPSHTQLTSTTPSFGASSGYVEDEDAMDCQAPAPNPIWADRPGLSRNKTFHGEQVMRNACEEYAKEPRRRQNDRGDRGTGRVNKNHNHSNRGNNGNHGHGRNNQGGNQVENLSGNGRHPHHQNERGRGRGNGGGRGGRGGRNKNN